MLKLTRISRFDVAPGGSLSLLPWVFFVLLLIAAPWLWQSAASRSLLAQIATLMIFALSYNMLLGQGGMLSFGHAVYAGLGGVCTMHAINWATRGGWSLPLFLMPLAGGLAGLLFGALFGYLNTKRSGTTFAMITLGIGELVFASAAMLPSFFGGESGVATNRVYGTPWLGLDFASSLQVYYLIACWLLVCTLAMFAFTRTALGRLLNAVRDNPERVEFIGYSAHRVRYLTLMLSAGFAGIAGALAAINFEIASAENVSALRSGAVLLFTVIGGSGFFIGPMLGATVGVLFMVMLSAYTKAWSLYLGLFFIAMVRYAPGGIASLLALAWRVLQHPQRRRLLGPLVALGLMLLLMLSGAVWLVEWLYRVTWYADQGSGLAAVASNYAAVLAVVLLVGGAGGVRLVRPLLQRVWCEDVL